MLWTIVETVIAGIVAGRHAATVPIVYLLVSDGVQRIVVVQTPENQIIIKVIAL